MRDRPSEKNNLGDEKREEETEEEGGRCKNSILGNINRLTFKKESKKQCVGAEGMWTRNFKKTYVCVVTKVNKDIDGLLGIRQKINLKIITIGKESIATQWWPDRDRGVAWTGI